MNNNKIKKFKIIQLNIKEKNNENIGIPKKKIDEFTITFNGIIDDYNENRSQELNNCNIYIYVNNYLLK